MIRSTDELLRRVERLQIRCSSLIDGRLIGEYESTFKGEGLEFEETRPYQPGDEVRAIDWRVTARFSKPFVKLFRQQRQLTVHLLVDGSRSMHAPAYGRTPADVATEVAGILASVASADHDRVGLTLFTDSIEHTVEPQNGPSHVTRLMRDLICWRPAGIRMRLDLPLERLHRVQRSRCVVVLISDFLSVNDASSMRVISRLHDLIPVIVRHPSDEQLPRCGMLQARDPETGRMRWIDTMNAGQRREFDQAARAQRLHLDQMFAGMRCLPLWIRCDQDVVAALHHYFDRRGRLR
jgi:uncharacterized protein (DUF58 family)